MSVVDKIIAELQEHKYPLYLFGKGTTTNRIIDFLCERNIDIAGIIVNHQFYKHQQIKGFDVYCYEDFLMNHECELLICTGDWKSSDFVEPYIKNIKKVHAYDFWGLFAIEEWNLWDNNFLNKNQKRLNWFRNKLYDEKSRKVFDDNKKQRSTLCYSREFDLPENQYFDDNIINFSDKEVFVDCGAYHGENLIEYLNIRHSKGRGGLLRAYEFEADSKNVSELQIATNSIDNVIIIPKGVWNKSCTIYLQSFQKKSSKVSENSGIPLQVITIDEVCHSDQVTFIKMDVEGAELRALQGAEKTIRRCKPTLAVSVYHRPEDFLAIPEYIDSLGMNYRYYLRCYSQTGCETVLYAV